MTKKCISCNNETLYPDTVAECPNCHNYLRTIDDEHNTAFNKKNTSQASQNNDDPYVDFFKLDISKATSENKTIDIDNNSNEKYQDTPANNSYDTEIMRENDNFSTPIKSNTQSIFSQKDKQEVIDTTNRLTKYIMVEGVVKNVTEEEIPSFKIVRWFEALFLGIPYVNNNVRCNFQLYQGQGFYNSDSEICRHIIVFGKLTHGQLPENNRVKVWGREDRSGAIRAYKILNLTSETEIGINHGIHPGLVWSITFLLSFLMVLIIYTASRISWEQVFTNIITAIIVIFIPMLWIKSKFGKKKR